MTTVETLQYVSSQAYGKTWGELDHYQQTEILYRKDNVGMLCSLIADKKFLDLKRNGRIQL